MFAQKTSKELEHDSHDLNIDFNIQEFEHVPLVVTARINDRDATRT